MKKLTRDQFYIVLETYVKKCDRMEEYSWVDSHWFCVDEAAEHTNFLINSLLPIDEAEMYEAGDYLYSKDSPEGIEKGIEMANKLYNQLYGE